MFGHKYGNACNIIGENAKVLGNISATSIGGQATNIINKGALISGHISSSDGSHQKTVVDTGSELKDLDPREKELMSILEDLNNPSLPLNEQLEKIERIADIDEEWANEKRSQFSLNLNF